MIRTAVILAAGNGTRLRPLTNVVPKELFPLIDTPVIDYVLQEGLVPGIEEVVFVTRRNKPGLTDYLATGGSDALRERLQKVNLRIVYQEDLTQEYGTAAVLRRLSSDLREPFLFLFPDSFGLPSEGRLERMTHLFEEKQAVIMSLIPIQEYQLALYGLPLLEFVQENLFRINGVLEKPTSFPNTEHLANPGGFIVTPDVFPYLDRVEPLPNGEIPFSTALSDYSKDHPVLGQVYRGPFFETGNRADYVRAGIEMARLREDTCDIFRDSSS